MPLLLLLSVYSPLEDLGATEPAPPEQLKAWQDQAKKKQFRHNNTQYINQQATALTARNGFVWLILFA